MTYRSYKRTVINLRLTFLFKENHLEIISNLLVAASIETVQNQKLSSFKGHFKLLGVNSRKHLLKLICRPVCGWLKVVYFALDKESGYDNCSYSELPLGLCVRSRIFRLSPKQDTLVSIPMQSCHLSRSNFWVAICCPALLPNGLFQKLCQRFFVNANTNLV